jgi:hypothetical protein
MGPDFFCFTEKLFTTIICSCETHLHSMFLVRWTNIYLSIEDKDMIFLLSTTYRCKLSHWKNSIENYSFRTLTYTQAGLRQTV